MRVQNVKVNGTLADIYYTVRYKHEESAYEAPRANNILMISGKVKVES